MAGVVCGSLQEVPFEKIHRSWVKAFSDYQVNIAMTPGMLSSFFGQNSVSFAASVGAFDGDELVGFWINGLRKIGGKNVAYDSGTALWPEYRGKGISKALAVRSNEILKRLGVSYYQLEVIDENEKAYNLYLKDGFVVTRRFACLRSDVPTLVETREMGDIEVGEGNLDKALLNVLPSMEYEPSWQNTMESMLNISDLVRLVVARDGGKVVGYGIVQPERGRISQIGIANEHWDTELPSLILNRLISLSKTKEVAAINVEKGAEKTLELLLRHNFTKFAGQYEMRKEL